MVDEIHLVSEPRQEVAPQPEPAPQPKANPVNVFRNDNDVTTAAERIRRIHDLLRNNANGADIVQSMTTREISDEMLFEGRNSSVRESSNATIRSDGRMVQNPYFRDQAD
jgi:hypothetical protein